MPIRSRTATDILNLPKLKRDKESASSQNVLLWLDMNIRILSAVLVAIGTGIAIASQSSISGRVGGMIGPIGTGLLVNAMGGMIAMVIVIILIASGAFAFQGHPIGRVLTMTGIAGMLGILIIVGISFSVQRVGVTAGLASIIIAQLLSGVVADALGVTGGTPVAVDLRRLSGVAAMALGVWLLVPRT